MFQIIPIDSSIFHLKFKKKADMFLGLMRCQEFYECRDKNIRGKKFSLEKLIEAYCKMNDEGSFTYFDDWSAFNIPDYSIRNFLELNGDNLLEHEKVVFDKIGSLVEIKSNIAPTAKSYLIATYTHKNEDSQLDLDHEIAHGLFYTSTMYNKIVTDMVNRMDKKVLNRLFNSLRKMNYCDEVLHDEVQAYLSTGAESMINCRKDIARPFAKFFKQYIGSIKAKIKRKARI
jgi:hypothetical protein